ncbi:MAG: DUF1768 domain-containing protein [Verrucomicrobia bacterium]|nr:DUF1768 domain-containing protein [Verrucomicrobiota bacterium]
MTTALLPAFFISSQSHLHNDTASRFEYGGLHFKCATAAYEAEKFYANPAYKERFTTLSAKEAFTLSSKLHLEKSPDWFERRAHVMYHVLNAKIGQNPSCQQALKDTGSAYLAYEGIDPFWNCSLQGSGQNYLGHYLMQLRERYCGTAVVPSPLSSEIPSPLPILGKSEEAIREEISTLNQQMDDAEYEKHTQIARRPENSEFTRFPTNNFPYDATLVPLKSGRYINANFVLEQEFICTQSPLPKTAEDFWQVVLEQNVRILAMLNRIGDPGDYIYFPKDLEEEMHYGSIHLRLKEDPLFFTDPTWQQAPHLEEPHAFTIRHIKIWREGEQPHYVHHFQYHNWRDFSIGNTHAVAKMVTEIDALHKEGPILVHCHAGVGRTSALITILDQHKKQPEQVDVMDCVRRQRDPQEGRYYGMMQAPEQYLFSYQVLEELRS